MMLYATPGDSHWDERARAALEWHRDSLRWTGQVVVMTKKVQRKPFVVLPGEEVVITGPFSMTSPGFFNIRTIQEETQDGGRPRPLTRIPQDALDLTPVLDADGEEVDVAAGLSRSWARRHFSFKVRASGCEHYIDDAARAAGWTMCIRCQQERAR